MHLFKTKPFREHEHGSGWVRARGGKAYRREPGKGGGEGGGLRGEWREHLAADLAEHALDLDRHFLTVFRRKFNDVVAGNDLGLGLVPGHSSLVQQVLDDEREVGRLLRNLEIEAGKRLVPVVLRGLGAGLVGNRKGSVFAVVDDALH